MKILRKKLTTYTIDKGNVFVKIITYLRCLNYNYICLMLNCIGNNNISKELKYLPTFNSNLFIKWE